MNKHFQKYYICYNSLEEIIRKSFIDIQNLAFFFFNHRYIINNYGTDIKIFLVK